MEKLPEYSSQPTHLPAFMQEFDGSQPELSMEEKLEVGRVFNSFVDDVMLRHINGVRSSNGNDPNWPMNTLHLVLPTEEGKWLILLEDLTRQEETEDSAGFALKNVELTRLDDTGNARETSSYSRDQDGVVRRRDYGDKWAEQELLRQAGLEKHPVPIPMDASEEELSELFWAQADAIYDENMERFQNDALEETMGLNSQPISRQELGGLINFLAAPQIRINPLSAF